MIPIRRAHLEVAAGSHPGLRGKNNEDVYSVTAYKVAQQDQTGSIFAIVADGIGGHLAGEVASGIAVEMISEAVAQSDGSQPTAIMQAAILQASQAIYAQSENDEAKEGMGTTVACVWIIGDRIYTASAGNSRIYLLRNQQLLQANYDHTWVQEAIDAGALTTAQAREHPHHNVIRRFLGSKQPLDVDLRLRLTPQDDDRQALANQGARMQPGDRLLLCSDGLNDMVEDQDIRQILLTYPIKQAVYHLIDKANQNGGKDNITVVILEMPSKGGFKPVRPGIKNPVRLGLLIGLLLLLAFLTVMTMVWMGWRIFG
jgi:serine/threonine protein phosphatase PrpC